MIIYVFSCCKNASIQFHFMIHSKLENLIKRPAWSVCLHCYNERRGKHHLIQLLLWFIQEILKGKYHCTVNLLFDWFGVSCMTTDNYCFYLQNRLTQTSQTGGQWYSDTSPFSIPWVCTIKPFVAVIVAAL